MPGKADPDRAGLQKDWLEAFGSPPPAYASVAFLRKALAHEAQVRQYGGLPAATRRTLSQIATGKPVEEAASGSAAARRASGAGMERAELPGRGAGDGLPAR